MPDQADGSTCCKTLPNPPRPLPYFPSIPCFDSCFMGAGEIQGTGILRAKGSLLLQWAEAEAGAWMTGPGLHLEGALPHSPEGKGQAKGRTGQRGSLSAGAKGRIDQGQSHGAGASNRDVFRQPP